MCSRHREEWCNGGRKGIGVPWPFGRVRVRAGLDKAVLCLQARVLVVIPLLHLCPPGLEELVPGTA